MPLDELLGLIATVALIGAVIGGLLVARLFRPTTPVEDQRQRLRDAYAEWLAAHLGLSRATASFAAAVRALASERKDSAYFDLRCQELSRAREHWHQSMQRMETSESTMFLQQPVSPNRWARYRDRRHLGALLRESARGGEGEYYRLLSYLHQSDEHATQLARQMADQLTGQRRTLLPARMIRYVADAYLHTIDRWQEDTTRRLR